MISKSAPRSLTEHVYRQLRADLVACRIPPGEKIVIADTCARLSASLSAVREALSGLTAEGLAGSEPQRGFFAAPVSEEDLLQVTEARIEIEAICLRSSMVHGDIAWESMVIGAAHELSRAERRPPGQISGLSEGWVAAHAAFHEALVAGCTNDVLREIRRNLYERSERYRHLSVLATAPDRDVDSEHRRLAAAVLDRDIEGAISLMQKHVQETTNALIAAGVATERLDRPGRGAKRRSA
jgi:DNA-binding GntR family transcriptional regulator